MIVGATGNTHVASSLARAAQELGHRVRLIDTGQAYRGNFLLRSLFWHLGGRRPLNLRQFSQTVADAAVAERPRILITVGQVPVTAAGIGAMRAMGVSCLHWSTDDPWNRKHRGEWHLRALRRYQVVFTPRRSNMSDFGAMGCDVVSWLPFAFDPALFRKPKDPPRGKDCKEVLFVGGADKDRSLFFADFIRQGPAPALVGGYWERYPEFRAFTLGQKSAAELAGMTASAGVNICLVRRANRDGHVMRSFEIPAVGGFMIAEDTAEHREIFGREGVNVLYFRTPGEATERTKWALEHPSERDRMAKAAHKLIATGGNTYRDRLSTMLTSLSSFGG